MTIYYSRITYTLHIYTHAITITHTHSTGRCRMCFNTPPRRAAAALGEITPSVYGKAKGEAHKHTHTHRLMRHT